MSGRTYPCIGGSRDMRRKWTLKAGPRKGQSVHNRPRCVACGAEAEFIVDVQVNWFRGDDEVLKACGQCRGDATKLLAGSTP